MDAGVLEGLAPMLLHPSTRGTPGNTMLACELRLYDWSYEETEHWVSDSLVLRQFCRV